MRKRHSAASVAAAAASTTSGTKPKAGPGRKAPVSASAATLRSVQANCLMNARYHAAREAFLDTVHRWLMFGVIGTGAGTVSTAAVEIGGVPWLSTAFGAAAALCGALDLTFDLSNRARSHALMKRRYFELLADVESGLKSVSEAEVCVRRYWADEEPPYHALLAGCWNAACDSVYGDEQEHYEIPPWHRALQSVIRFEGVRYRLKGSSASSVPRVM